MRTFERRVELELDGGTKLALFHGSPRSFEEGILATTPDEEVEEMLSGIDAPLLACGHTHFQLLRRVGESLLVNPGSVGLPFRRDGGVMQIAPWAEYGLVTVDGGRLGVDFRRTAYDVGAHAESMRRSGMPHAEWWTSLWADRQPAPVGPWPSTPRIWFDAR